MLPTACWTRMPPLSIVTAPRSSSDTANMPIRVGMKLIPESRSMLPKVKRGWPAAGSMPMQPMASPMNSDSRPFSGSPVPMKTAQVRPRQASQKYSKDEKLIATSARAGASTTRMITPKMPPSTEKTRLTPMHRSS